MRSPAWRSDWGSAARAAGHSTVGGGLVGAAAATIIYELVGALLFASSKTDLPLSASVVTRGMAELLTTTFAAAGAVLALSQSPKPRTSSSVAP